MLATKSVFAIEDETTGGIVVPETDDVVLRSLRVQADTGIDIQNDCDSITIEDTTIEGYRKFGIIIRGGRRRSPAKVVLRNVTIFDPLPGTPTQPLAIIRGGNRLPVRNLLMENVTIVGSGKPAIRSIKDSDNPDNATSDQVVLHGVQGAVLRRVRSLLGGENGISITFGSTGVTLIDCAANYCDGQGFHLGKHGHSGMIRVVRGECIGNGRNQEGRTDGNFAGALVQSADVIFEGWKTFGTTRGIIAGKTANVKAIDCDICCPIKTEAHGGAKVEVF